MVKVSYAKNKGGEIIHIKEAERQVDYFVDGIIYIARKGDVNNHHFAIKSGNSKYVTNESIEHYNAKMKLCYEKRIIVDDIEIIAHRTDNEVYINKKIIDAVFYDENDDIICLIEVVKTSDLTSEKIEVLKEYNIIRYDINIKPERIEFIPRKKDIEIRGNIDSFRTALFRFPRAVRDIKERIEQGRINNGFIVDPYSREVKFIKR